MASVGCRWQLYYRKPPPCWLAYSDARDSILRCSQRVRQPLRFGQTLPALGTRWIFCNEAAAGPLNEFPPFEHGNARNENGETGNKSVVEQIRALGPSYASLDDLVQSATLPQWWSTAAGIAGLRYDPHDFGGGTHENRYAWDLDPTSTSIATRSAASIADSI